MLINTDTLQFIVGTSYSSHCVFTLCLNSLLLMGDTLFLSWCVCVCVCEIIQEVQGALVRGHCGPYSLL